ncbi:MAG: tetratricopeptide repeat protein, partial [Anaerolineales bacterium]|nr:tetratricopeptide repeat protein [Anaerolineales bacterium]
AGNENRRLGLFTAVIQLLIYMAAPFLRDDNVSLFFFERLNADKFMVMVVLVPMVLALAIRFVRNGRRDVWVTAVIAAFATSTIHPLSAAMLALALAAFGGLHWLLNWRSRTAQRRTAGLALLVIAVMFLPLLQLILSRGSEPLASSYPASFEGWPLEEKAVPILPFVDVRGLDLYGTVPDLAQLEASQANESTNPFLIWRFDVNMNRQRLIVFDLNRYMSNPRLILEPPYLLALILLLFLLRRLRTDIAAQFVVSVTAAILVVMFVPFVTPLIGSFVMPWILWRFVWLLPYALIIALALFRLLVWFGIRSRLSAGLPDIERPFLRASGVVWPGRAALKQGAYFLFTFTAVIGLMLLPQIVRNMRTLASRPVSPYFFPTPKRIMTELIEDTNAENPAMVMADQDISVSVAAYAANAHIVAHRVPTTSEIFPADRQDDALQRLIDQDAFFDMTHLTMDAVTILDRYKTDYVVVSSGSALDLQLRLVPRWFTWVLDDQSYSLYRVADLPQQETAVLQANAALAAGDLEAAATLFTEALAAQPDDALALAGMADVAQAQGQFGETGAWLEQAAAVSDSPGLAFRLGQIDVERGSMAHGIDALRRAARQAPAVSRFQAALGDACLLAGDEACAEAAYTAVLNNQSLPDEAARLLTAGDLWRQQGRYDRAVPLYEQAVAMQPTLVNSFILETVYREAGQPDAALTLMADLQAAHPYAPDVALEAAAMQTALGDVDAAVGQYRRAIRLQRLQMLDTTNTRLLLVQLLLDNGRLDEAADELDQLLAISPKNASAHKLQGDLLRAQGQFDEATGAYQRAFLYDPTRVELYVSLTNLLRQFGGEPDEVLALLETAVRLNPDEPSLYLALGDQLQQAGELDEAIAAYQSALDRLVQGETAVQQRPSFPRQSRAFALLRLGQIYELLGQMETALDYFQAMAAAAPEIPWTQTLLGDAWQRRGEPEKAVALYEQAIAVDPTDINAAVNLAELLYAQGEVAQSSVYYHDALNLAVAQLAQFNTDLIPESRLLIPNASTPVFSDEAVDSAPQAADETAEPVDIVVQLSRIDENVAVLRTIVGLYQRFGQTEEGIALYQLWLAQGEADGWSALLLAQLHKGLGDLYLARADYESALAAYRQAVALDQWWVEAHVGLGQALIGLGEVSAAVESLETAVSIAPGSVEARVGLADA